MDINAHIVAVRLRRLTSVDPDSHTDISAFRPVLGVHPMLNLSGHPQRPSGTGKGSKYAVAGCVDLYTIRAADFGADDREMISDKCWEVSTELLCQLGRPLDVSEEEGDSSGWKQLAHST